MVKLTKRLNAVASLVSLGSSVADVGCDHGYVPVYLVKNNIAVSCVAMDINEKPLASCERLVKEEMLEEKIKTRISNGLEKLEKGECDTVIIAGMGGELIVDIISRCSFSNELHFILQPMTHPEYVRKYLYDNGYEIYNDIIVNEGKHLYSVFDTKYTGKITPKTQKDYFLGNIKDFSQKEYFLHLLNYLNNKAKSGVDLTEAISAVEEIL